MLVFWLCPHWMSWGYSFYFHAPTLLVIAYPCLHNPFIHSFLLRGFFQCHTLPYKSKFFSCANVIDALFLCRSWMDHSFCFLVYLPLWLFSCLEQIWLFSSFFLKSTKIMCHPDALQELLGGDIFGAEFSGIIIFLGREVFVSLLYRSSYLWHIITTVHVHTLTWLIGIY